MGAFHFVVVRVAQSLATRIYKLDIMGASSLPGVGGWFGWQAGLESSKVYGIATGVLRLLLCPSTRSKVARQYSYAL